MWGKKDKWTLALILAAGFAIKLPRLTEPPRYYFDECYYAFTASRYVQGDRESYNPWAKSTEPGNFYEWVHPPVAKLLISGGILLFGDNSLGWRVGPLLAGTGAILFAALFAAEALGSVPVALLTAGLLSVENLFFVQSRIAMNDMFFICFMLWGFWLYARWRNRKGETSEALASSLALGLALATKWTGVYAIGIVGLDLLWKLATATRWDRPRIWRAGGLFLWIPPLVYVASYAHFFWIGNGWTNWTILQEQMWWYHTRLKATHDYKSTPWDWIFNARPVWYWTERKDKGFTANIYNLGNSVILWTGLVASARWLWKRAWSREGRRLVLFAYILLWLPWAFSPRIMLFYHYTPAVPFLCMILANELWENSQSPRRGRRGMAYGIGAASLAWFAIYYPNSVGLQVSESFAREVYYLLPGWK